MANQIVISRIQNRRGIKENLPQPLLPGEFALTVDTGELWIGTDPAQPPFGVRTYGTGGGDISAAESIVDTQIVSAKFTPALDATEFAALVLYLTDAPTPAVVLDDTDILWDGGISVLIAADTTVDVANTISNIVTAVTNSTVGTLDAVTYNQLGAINDPSVNPISMGADAFDVMDGDFLFGIAGSNSIQGANAASLINKIHGAFLVTTLSNLQVTTSGIGVGASTFRDWEVFDSEASLPFVPTWSSTGTATADSVTDKMYLLSGDGINIDVDPANDAIRFTNTFVAPSTDQYVLASNTVVFTDITGLLFDVSVEDIIFLEYSINIDGAAATTDNYTAIGTMMIVGNANVGAGDATLSDTQTEVRDAALIGAGDIAFEALYVAGNIQLRYTNTFGALIPNATLRIIRRRWRSY